MKTYRFSELSPKVQHELIKERVDSGHFKTDMTILQATAYFNAWNVKFNKIGVVKLK